MRILLVLLVATFLVTSCKQKKEELGAAEASTEMIMEIKTNDSTATAIDSLNTEIKESSEKLEKLLKDLN